MREIKFRAWDETHKRMITSDVCVFYPSTPVPKMPTLFGVVEQTIDDETIIHPIQNGVLMQYTGLHDKNGKEIWEGDIVTCDEPMGIGRLFQQVKGEVHYLDNIASFGVRIATGDEGVGEMTHYSWDIGRFRNFEVIGNIYENPNYYLTTNPMQNLKGPIRRKQARPNKDRRTAHIILLLAVMAFVALSVWKTKKCFGYCIERERLLYNFEAALCVDWH